MSYFLDFQKQIQITQIILNILKIQVSIRFLIQFWFDFSFSVLEISDLLLEPNLIFFCFVRFGFSVPDKCDSRHRLVSLVTHSMWLRLYGFRLGLYGLVKTGLRWYISNPHWNILFDLRPILKPIIHYLKSLSGAIRLLRRSLQKKSSLGNQTKRCDFDRRHGGYGQMGRRIFHPP